jgi:hypothetical protein
MSKQIAILGIAAVLGLLPLGGGAFAADYPVGDDQPPVYHDRRAPGPVVYDERGAGRRVAGPAFDEEERPPVAVGRPAYRDGFDGPVAFAPPPYGYGDRFRPAPLYRAAAVPAGPAFDEGYGGPDVACTVDQAQSTTPAGWRKIVTRRTCYRR